MENLGGITLKEVIVFQTQIMMGAQFGRIQKEDVTRNDLIVACLRMGWNDAFRHTSKNTKIKDSTKPKKDWLSVLEYEEISWRKKDDHRQDYDDFICGTIISNEIVLETFKKFTVQKTTQDKIKVINDNFDKLKELFSRYKETDGKQQLCFGHFQKMFNIATKLYACLYVCHEYLEINETLFEEQIVDNIKYADCPIDSIILEQLSKKAERDYTKQKWSKYGTEKHKTEDYAEVQNAISNLDDTKEKSNLYYDFIAWKQS